MIIGLMIILLLVLLLPFTKFIETNLEIFLFVIGIAAVLVSQVMDWPLIKEALVHPTNITLAVFVAGLLFRWFNGPIQKVTLTLSKAIPFRLFIFIFVATLGLISSVITAIVAAIILVSIVSILKLDRKSEIRLIVLACFSIWLSAVLTPIGEPLSTITVSKLNENFFYLFDLLGVQVISFVVIFGALSAFFVKKPGEENKAKTGNGQYFRIRKSIRNGRTIGKWYRVIRRNCFSKFKNLFSRHGTYISWGWI